MKLEQCRAKEIKNALVAHNHSEYPPRPLIRAVAHLIGSGSISSALGARDDAGRWRCVVVTDDHVVYAEAFRENDTWYSFDSHEQQHTELKARMWARADVTRLELVEMREFGTAWDSEATFNAVMSDGETLPLPPNGQYVHTSAEEQFATLLADIRQSLRA
jgi:hypothetical protein